MKAIKENWSRIIIFAFACGLIAQLITAHFFTVYAGWELFWEIPLIIIIAWSGIRSE